MSRAAVNPVVYSMPSPQGLPLSQLLSASNSQTWKRGEWCFQNSSSRALEVVVGTGKTTPWGILADDQDTSTSSSTVRAYELMVGTRFLMYLGNGGSNAAWNSGYRGVRYGVRGISNITMIDVATTSGSLEVICPASELFDYADSQLDMDAAPGLVLVEFKGVL